jgi:hypothetical protein
VLPAASGSGGATGRRAGAARAGPAAAHLRLLPTRACGAAVR